MMVRARRTWAQPIATPLLVRSLRMRATDGALGREKARIPPGQLGDIKEGGRSAKRLVKLDVLLSRAGPQPKGA
jgi:hypothetical protein